MKHLAILVLIITTTWSSPCFAQAVPDVNLGALLRRVENLEEENRRLRSELTEVRAQIISIKQAEPITTGKPQKVSTSTPSPEIKMYGFIKADAIYNDSQAGEFAINAPREGSSADDDEFHMNVRDTRWGIELSKLPIGENGEARAKIETDFWGDPATGSAADQNNSPELRIRQAYIQLAYPDWDLLAGQTWDFFAPLNPYALTFSVLWRSGNMGDRHPQLRYTRSLPDWPGDGTTMQLGIVETTDLDSNNGYPVGMGYIFTNTELFGMPLYLGTGGVYGEQDIATNVSKDAPVWGGTAVMKLTLNEQMTLQGEGYLGQGLAAFRGGSSDAELTDGIDGSTVQSAGGWLQLLYHPADRWQFTVASGIDDPRTRDNGTSTTLWDYNYAILTNARYKLTTNLYWGIEYQRQITKYNQQDGGDNNRVISSLIYSF